jgi:hypothetical protein
MICCRQSSAVWNRKIQASNNFQQLILLGVRRNGMRVDAPEAKCAEDSHVRLNKLGKVFADKALAKGNLPWIVPEPFDDPESEVRYLAGRLRL